MKKLIPKSISNDKLKIWRNLGWDDILVFFVVVSLSVIFAFSLPISQFRKVLIGAVLFLIAIPIILPLCPPLKGWQVISLLFKHLASVKKYRKNTNNDTSLLVPYDKVVGKNFIKTCTLKGKSTLIGCVSVKGFDIRLLSADEQELKISMLQDILKFADFEISIMKLEKPLSLQENINYLKQKLNSLDNTNVIRKQQIEAQITFLEQEVSNGYKTKKHFFIFTYGKKEQELQENINYLISKLINSSFSVEQINNFAIVQTLSQIWNPYKELITKEQFDKCKNNLSELLSFEKFKLHQSYFKGDDIYYALNGIYDYPLQVDDLWGASLACNEQTVIFDIKPLNSQKLKKGLNKALNNSLTYQHLIKDNVASNKNNYEVSAYQKLIADINGDNEVVKNVNILFLNYGINLKILKQRQTKLKQSLKELNMKLNPLFCQQLDALNDFLPKTNGLLKYGQEMPCETIAFSFPFLSSSLEDECGMYLGQTNLCETVLFDQFKLDNKRKNHNQIIIGTSGSGKSFATKKMISFHVNMNRKVIVIDPEREYKKLAEFYHGQWIDTGDASKGKINPLQIIDNHLKEETNEKSAPLSNHLRFLTHWFKTLYPDFNNREFNLLFQNLKLLYQKFNITNESNIFALANNQFPTMTDFLKLLVNENKINPSKLLAEFIAIISTDFGCNGKYQKLWNGHTTLSFNNNFVVYDVLTLFEQDDTKIISAQLLLVLGFIRKEVKSNRFLNKNKIIIVVDEAHLLIDKDNLLALNFMYQMIKRIRKYNGSMIITTQNLKDFIGSQETKKQVSAIINNSQYSLIFNLAPSDLQDVADLYASYGGLTSTEKDYIARANKGQALFVVSGHERYCLNVEASENEQKGFE